MEKRCWKPVLEGHSKESWARPTLRNARS